MSFNTAISGLRAANSDLNVIGNNIANASTTGFKSSRAEFADVYASALIGTGKTAIGSGVLLADVAQQFTQGNIGFTGNNLDLAINGEGFFILNDGSGSSYTRAGLISLDKDGYLVANDNAKLQGFAATPSGALAGNLSDLRISSQNLDPVLTTLVSQRLNLDAAARPTELRSFDSSSAGTAIGRVQLGASLGAIDNGYGAASIDLLDNDSGQVQSFTATAGASARAIANGINAQGVSGLSASAQTQVTVGAFAVAGGDVSLNGIPLTGSDATSWAAQLNAINGFSATDHGNGTVTVQSLLGENLEFSLTAGSVSLQGPGDAAASTLDVANPAAVVGGNVTINSDERFSYMNGSGDGSVFAPTQTLGSVISANLFSPSNQDSYNYATAVTIYDSLGNDHTMTQYFVKESAYKVGATNRWSMYVQIDGENVGDPIPGDTVPTLAAFSLAFNSDGSIDTSLSDPVVISNWNPKDENGADNGALTGSPGTTLPLPSPAASSAFEVDLTSSTQQGSAFAVYELDQNGYTTGRLAGIDIAAQGEIYARYSNGQSQVLGQVALASFNNPQGLSPVGDTQWAETFDSGEPVVNVPGSSRLGLLQAGALEESNTDLSNELVNLIIAQRNYQANAKTIQTVDQVTQAMINIR
ncbi:MAG: flagellar hook-basal body complex protein [Pseudomonadota bacterium]|nr:flagellar hook-basal body complex protein [Pseudomonadota bacterium]